MRTSDVLRLAAARTAAATGEARRLRQDAHLSLADVAATCDVDQATVHRWECGKRRPSLPAALRYAILLEGLQARDPSPPTVATLTAAPAGKWNGGPERAVTAS